MDTTALTRELVAIPSHDDPTACGDYLESWLRDETDADVRRDDHGNVFAARGDPALWFVGHHDVVPPADDQWDGEQFAVEERDGRLYGRGTADMKGSLAAMCCAFRDADAPLGVVSFVGEEQGGEGCRAAIDDGFAPTRAVVGEGSTGYSSEGVTDVAVAHKGRRASTLTAHGTATHASTPEDGDNAVYRACDVVADLRELLTPETEVFGETMTGTLVVTGIEGGESWNSVPERCAITVDERTIPGERADIESLTDDHVEVTIDQDLPPMRCGDEAFAERALDAAHEVQDATPELVTKPHATDAGWLADRAGTQCLVVGAAEPGEAHTATESVRIEVLKRCYDLYRRLADGDYR